MLITLAGLTVEISPRGKYLEEKCRPYLAKEGALPLFSVFATDEDIARENTEGGQYPASYLESLAVYRKIADKAPEYNTFLFHGSVLEMDGVGYLFTAPSGTGKSTHAALWRQVFGDRVTMINDDKPLLTWRDGHIWASGTPWDGKHGLSTNRTVPLRAICFLERGETNGVISLTPGEAYEKLILQTHRPGNSMMLIKTLELLDKTVENVPLYRMHCNMNQEAALVAYESMKGMD